LCILLIQFRGTAPRVPDALLPDEIMTTGADLVSAIAAR
jgi:hypothetical protein